MRERCTGTELRGELFIFFLVGGEGIRSSAIRYMKYCPTAAFPVNVRVQLPCLKGLTKQHVEYDRVLMNTTKTFSRVRLNS